jgi:DNA ligase-1
MGATGKEGIVRTLYKRTSTGAVQQWQAEQRGERYRTTSGQVGGKLVVSAWTLATPKNVGRSNEVSASDQAGLEVQAMYTKKREKGYTDSAERVDSAAVFQPMLAKKFEDYADTLTYPVYCQPKLDGIRCIARKEGLFSRNGKPITSCPHIERALEFFFKWHPFTVLDGELYADKLKNNFNEICSLVKRTKPSASDLQRAEDTVQYWIYDVAVMGGPKQEDATFSERNVFLQRSVFATDHGTEDTTSRLPLVEVETVQVSNRRDLDSCYEGWLSEGMEGQMVRINRPYQNKRTEFLLKRKEFQDAEYKVLDVIEGIGNRAGTAGKMRLTDGTVTFDSNIKGDFAYVTRLLGNRRALIGKTVTVKFFNLTPAGVPRFPFVIAVRDYE